MITMASYLKGEPQQKRESKAEQGRLGEVKMILRERSESREIRGWQSWAEFWRERTNA